MEDSLVYSPSRTLRSRLMVLQEVLTPKDNPLLMEGKKPDLPIVKKQSSYEGMSALNTSIAPSIPQNDMTYADLSTLNATESESENSLLITKSKNFQNKLRSHFKNMPSSLSNPVSLQPTSKETTLNININNTNGISELGLDSSDDMNFEEVKERIKNIHKRKAGDNENLSDMFLPQKKLPEQKHISSTLRAAVEGKSQPTYSESESLKESSLLGDLKKSVVPSKNDINQLSNISVEESFALESQNEAKSRFTHERKSINFQLNSVIAEIKNKAKTAAEDSVFKGNQSATFGKISNDSSGEPCDGSMRNTLEVPVRKSPQKLIQNFLGEIPATSSRSLQESSRKSDKSHRSPLTPQKSTSESSLKTPQKPMIGGQVTIEKPASKVTLEYPQESLQSSKDSPPKSLEESPGNSIGGANNFQCPDGNKSSNHSLEGSLQFESQEEMGSRFTQRKSINFQLDPIIDQIKNKENLIAESLSLDQENLLLPVNGITNDSTQMSSSKGVSRSLEVGLRKSPRKLMWNSLGGSPSDSATSSQESARKSSNKSACKGPMKSPKESESKSPIASPKSVRKSPLQSPQKFTSKSPMASPKSPRKSPFKFPQKSASKSIMASQKSSCKSPLKSPKSMSKSPIASPKSALKSSSKSPKSASKSPMVYPKLPRKNPLKSPLKHASKSPMAPPKLPRKNSLKSPLKHASKSPILSPNSSRKSPLKSLPKSRSKSLMASPKSPRTSPLKSKNFASKSPILSPKFACKSPLKSPSKSASKSPILSPKSAHKSPLKSSKSASKSPILSPKSARKSPLKSPKSASKNPILSPNSARKNPLKSHPKSTNKSPTASAKSPRKSPLKSLSNLASKIPIASPKFAQQTPMDVEQEPFSRNRTSLSSASPPESPRHSRKNLNNISEAVLLESPYKSFRKPSNKIHVEILEESVKRTSRTTRQRVHESSSVSLHGSLGENLGNLQDPLETPRKYHRLSLREISEKSSPNPMTQSPRKFCHSNLEEVRRIQERVKKVSNENNQITHPKSTKGYQSPPQRLLASDVSEISEASTVEFEESISRSEDVLKSLFTRPRKSINFTIDSALAQLKYTYSSTEVRSPPSALPMDDTKQSEADASHSWSSNQKVLSENSLAHDLQIDLRNSLPKSPRRSSRISRSKNLLKNSPSPEKMHNENKWRPFFTSPDEASLKKIQVSPAVHLLELSQNSLNTNSQQSFIQPSKTFSSKTTSLTSLKKSLMETSIKSRQSVLRKSGRKEALTSSAPSPRKNSSLLNVTDLRNKSLVGKGGGDFHSEAENTSNFKRGSSKTKQEKDGSMKQLTLAEFLAKMASGSLPRKEKPRSLEVLLKAPSVLRERPVVKTSKPAFKKQKAKGSPPKPREKNLPRKMNRNVFEHFSQHKFSTEAAEAFHHVMEAFWRNVASDLDVLLTAKRDKILNKNHVYILIKQLKLVSSKEVMHAMMQEYLPADEWQKVIPAMYAFNQVFPKPKN